MSVNRKEVILMDIDKIRADPNQPRKEFSDEDIAGTAFTIESQGIINPIEVDEHGMIVTGEIRFRAAQMAGLKQVPVVVWKNGSHKRFERQVVENMHQHQLSDRDRENAIVKLWNTKNEKGEPIYPTMDVLANSVGLSSNRVSEILTANKRREEVPELQEKEVSTNLILKTIGVSKDVQIKIIDAVLKDKDSKKKDRISGSEISDLIQLANISEALFNKTMQKEIPIQRALEAAETMQKIADQGVALTEDQKQNLADKVAEDETLLDKYKSAVLEKVRQVATAPRQPRITEPIGRESPIQHMIKVKDEVLDRYRIYLGNCDINERRWAKRIMIETRDELSLLIEMIKDD